MGWCQASRSIDRALGRAVLGLAPVTGGSIRYGGREIGHLSRRERRTLSSEIQVVFQDPYSSLNPRLSAGTIVGEPLENFGLARGSDKDGRVAELFKRVGLRPEAMRKYPHEFSGGQRQRIGVARALAAARIIDVTQGDLRLDPDTEAEGPIRLRRGAHFKHP